MDKKKPKAKPKKKRLSCCCADTSGPMGGTEHCPECHAAYGERIS